MGNERCAIPPTKTISSERVKRFTRRLRKAREQHQTPTTRFPFGLIGPLWYHTPVARPDKFHDVKWRYGVELELEFYELVQPFTSYKWFISSELLAELANHLLTLTTKDGEAGITEDSSLVNGWEVVLAASSIKTVMKRLTPILTDKDIKPFISPNTTAALHVTVDRFDTIEEERAFHDFWDNDKTFDLFSDIIQRKPNGYCKQRNKKPRKYVRQRMRPDGRNHYWRCSVRSNGALEVRVFKADYKVEGLYRQLQMVHAVNMAVRRGVHDYDELCKVTRNKIKRLTTPV